MCVCVCVCVCVWCGVCVCGVCVFVCVVCSEEDWGWDSMTLAAPPPGVSAEKPGFRHQFELPPGRQSLASILGCLGFNILLDSPELLFLLSPFESSTCQVYVHLYAGMICNVGI